MLEYGVRKVIRLRKKVARQEEAIKFAQDALELCDTQSREYERLVDNLRKQRAKLEESEDKLIDEYNKLVKKQKTSSLLHKIVIGVLTGLLIIVAI